MVTMSTNLPQSDIQEVTMVTMSTNLPLKWVQADTILSDESTVSLDFPSPQDSLVFLASPATGESTEGRLACS